MSNAPKTGFWQTIPGLITATAGFLSAATGAIVALNQTGVVDLKKMTGAKPPEQVASAPSTTTTSEAQTQKESKPADPQPAADVAKPTEVPPVKAEPNQPAPTKPAEPEAKTVTESKPIEPPPAEKPVVVPAPVATSVVAKQEPAPTKPPEPVVEAVKKPEPVTESKPIAPPTRVQPDPVPVTSTKVVERPPTQPVPEPPARPTQNPVSTAPPSTTADSRTRNPGSVPPTSPSRVPPPPSANQPTQERVADARTQERVPPPRPADDPGDQPRVVRAPGSTAPDGGRSNVPDRPPPPRDATPGGVRVVQPGPAERSRELDLTGLKLSIPSGWMRVENQAGAVAGEATLRIVDPAGDGTVQVSRYMGAKGKEMEDKTIDRWLSQMTGARGGSVDRRDAKIERRQHGAMRITSVEFSGALKGSPRDPGPGSQRMMGFIVDHPLGPHIITITGPAEAFSRWSAAIDGFIASARPD